MENKDEKQTSKDPCAKSEAEMRHYIKNFSFDRCKQGNQGFQRVLLQLFGFVGHGKSSFINTCLMVWNSTEYINHAHASGSHESSTTQRISYPMTRNITLVDNRGCSTMNEYETGEIFAQLGNLLPLDKPVDWKKGFGLVQRIVEAEPIVKSSDFIVPIFVYRVTKALDDLQEIKTMLNTCKKLTGVFPIVVLTHKNDTRLKSVIKSFRDIGTERLFELENYTEENQKHSKDTDNSVIKFLHNVVQDAQFRVNNVRDPGNEMIERKIFVLNYLHDKDLEAHKRILDRQSAVENVRLEQEKRLKQEEVEKERQEAERRHREEMRKLEEEFSRQRLRDEFEQSERLKNLQKKKGRKSGFNGK